MVSSCSASNDLDCQFETSCAMRVRVMKRRISAAGDVDASGRGRPAALFSSIPTAGRGPNWAFILVRDLVRAPIDNLTLTLFAICQAISYGLVLAVAGPAPTSSDARA